ncbi:TetR family transcriptional regulator [Azospirillum palustre]|uniref:TetR family transcriptional regulator n=1 Tax=Azospirillum palustre TaxID=2044885 RepID=A0A2B8BFS8_9PROT|nr:TetR/AcrR family transcriptional regulator [Azospirillum palustre]PGH56242.1 TetR family transcriptional regulator [Azospirillum palustre]
MSSEKSQLSPRIDKTGNIDILIAAAECFMEQGYHATSIDDVARRLGATKGRIYHYYRSKTELFFDVHREGMRRNFEAVTPVMKGPEPAAKRLSAMFRQHALSMMENLALEAVVVQGVEMHRFGATTPEQRRTLAELMTVRNDFESLFKRVAYEGVEDGSIRTSDVSVAVKVALGAINWLSIWYRPRPAETRDDREILADKIVGSIMQGLNAPA